MEARNSDHEICRSSSSSSSSSSSCSSPTSMSNLGNNSGNNNDGSESNSRRYGINIAATNLIHSPLTAFLEYSGILGGGGFNGSNNEETEEFESNPFEDSTASAHHQEVTIRIIGSDSNSSATNGEGQPDGDVEGNSAYTDNADVATGMSNNDSSSPSSSSSSSYQRYDIQNIARWIEQILPFSLLLLLVFIRQHLQGFCVALWISAVLFKSNDIVKKQTALKGERKNSVLFCITTVFVLHVMIIYWWHINDDLLYPLVLLPPKTMPSFWNAVFIIVMNDVMARQMSMAFKCIILMYYKNSKGHNFRKQGQMLTLVEYLLLLYRVLLPTPVWYRFFLNKEYGSLFSSLITGLYLTFKLTSVLGKAQLFFTALRALSRKDMHYGSHATFEQVNAAGDLCAICQEKMHVPILLRCKHIFCEDCVSEWFERERTCPLCRALVKPADIRSYSDGSTSLLFQLF